MVLATGQALPGTSSSFLEQADEPLGVCRCVQAHPAWMLPVFFMTYWCTLGPISVLQGFAADFYEENAQLAWNIPMAVSGFVGFFITPMIGLLSDRYGRKKFLILCSAGYAWPYILLWALDLSASRSRYDWFLVMQGFQGLAGSSVAVFGLCFAYIADVVGPQHRAAVSGIIIAMGGSLAYTLSPLFFAWIYRQGGRDSFLQALTASHCLWLLLMMAVPESNPKWKRTAVPLQKSDLNPLNGFRLLRGAVSPETTQQLRKLFLIVLLLYVMKMGLILSLGLFAKEVFGFEAQDRSYLNSVYGAFQGIGQLSIGALLMSLSQRQTVGLGVFMGLVACTIPALPTSLISGAWLYVAEGFLAISFIAYTMCCSIATRIVPKEFAGEAAQLISTALTLCSGLGPLVFGLLVEAFLKTSYPGGALLIFAVVVFVDLLLCLKLPSDDSIEACQKPAGLATAA